jgi:NO-binding membrane sensor protein with MHYT domain
MNPAGYEIFLVGLSYLIAVYGSYTALQFAFAIPHGLSWAEIIGSVVGAALALGGAAWAMHFIGMNSVDLGVPVGFDPALVLASLAAALLAACAGFFIMGRSGGGPLNFPVGALAAGLGFALMQYTGMEAMIVPGKVSYDPTLLGASVAIAIVAAAGALWLAFHLQGNLMRLVSALFIGVGLCAMHYTAVYGLKLQAAKTAAADAALMSPATAAYAVFGITAAVLTLLLVYSSWKSARTLTSNL